MSRIRFDNDTEPAAPASGKTFVYVDVVDGHTKQKAADGTVIDLTLGGDVEGFYGITAKHQDDSTSFSGLDVFSFDEFNFYLTQNPGNTDEVQIQLRNLPGAAGGESNLGANVGSGQGNVFRDKTGITLNFKTLLQGSNITITDNADDITIASTGGGAGSGFYGITVGHSDDSSSFPGVNVIKFEVDNFYVTQNDPNTDEVVVNFRIDADTLAAQLGAIQQVLESNTTVFSNVKRLIFNDASGF
jgi:hypothetical protein